MTKQTPGGPACKGHTVNLHPARRAPCSSLSPAITDDHEHDPADQTNTANHGWERDRVLFFLGGLNRADIEDLLALGVGDSTVDQRDNPNSDKNDTDDSSRFHCQSVCELKALGGR